MSVSDLVTNRLDRVATFGDRLANRMHISWLTYRQKQRILRVGLYAVVAISLVFFAFPMYWMLNTSFQPANQIVSGAAYLPFEFTFDTYVQTFTERDLARWYFNSVLVAVLTIIATVVFSTMAGYGLTRIEFRGRKMFARLILFSYMFPPILLAFPQYQIWRRLGWLNTYWGITIAHVVLALPFSMWAMWKFFQTVPIAYEEAVWMNGGSRFDSFKDVALPMAKPGMVAVAIFTFAVTWNDFTMATILLPEESMYTLPPAIQTFTEDNFVKWGQIMAASTMMSIPPFLLVYKLQKSILEGFKTAGM